jgi:hypothetical protein
VVIAAPYGRSALAAFVSPGNVIRKHNRGNATGSDKSLKQKTHTPVKSASSPRAGLRELLDRAASLRALHNRYCAIGSTVRWRTGTASSLRSGS